MRTQKPAVAELHHAPQGVFAFAAEEDRRIRSLLRLRIEPDRIEGDEFAVEFRFLLVQRACIASTRSRNSLKRISYLAP